MGGWSGAHGMLLGLEGGCRAYCWCAESSICAKCVKLPGKKSLNQAGMRICLPDHFDTIGGGDRGTVISNYSSKTVGQSCRNAIATHLPDC